MPLSVTSMQSQDCTPTTCTHRHWPSMLHCKRTLSQLQYHKPNGPFQGPTFYQRGYQYDLNAKSDLRGQKEPNLCGWTLQQTTKVNYFGLILDKRLTWKAYTALWNVRSHLLKPGVWNPEYCTTGYTPWWSDPYWPIAPQSGDAGFIHSQQDVPQYVTEISLFGCHRDDDNDPNNCNRGPPGTPSTTRDDCCGGPGRDLPTNVQLAVGIRSPQILVMLENLRTWNQNPSYRWGLISGCEYHKPVMVKFPGKYKW